MVLVLVQQPRGVLHVLYAGDFTQAKAWARELYGEVRTRFSNAKWKMPGDLDYWQSKQLGKQVTLPCVSGPVAMKFVAEQVL